MRACFFFFKQIYFKSKFKKSRARFLTPLAGETKMKSLASPVFNLKALVFGAFFAYFHLFEVPLSDTTFPKLFRNISCSTNFRQRKPIEDSPSGFEISFKPIVILNLLPHPFVFTNMHTVNESSSGGKPYIAKCGSGGSIRQNACPSGTKTNNT